VQAGRLAGQLQGAAEPGEQRAEGEDAAEQHRLVDAERGDHLAVLRCGAHQYAPAGAMEQQPEGEQDERAGGDEQQFILRETLTEYGDGAAEAGRARPE